MSCTLSAASTTTAQVKTTMEQLIFWEFACEKKTFSPNKLKVSPFDKLWGPPAGRPSTRHVQITWTNKQPNNTACHCAIFQKAFLGASLNKPHSYELTKLSVMANRCVWKTLPVPHANKRASRCGSPQVSLARRRHRNCFPTQPEQAFPKKVNISWGQRSVDAIKPL